MIEEVINSILDAEDAAKRRVEEAEAKAAEIVAQAEAEISSYKKQQAALNKAAFADAVKQADKLAEQKASERLAQLNADTDKETAKYVKNVDKAVKLIVEAN